MSSAGTATLYSENIKEELKKIIGLPLSIPPKEVITLLLYTDMKRFSFD
jgi:hypothetical protein